MRRGDHGWFCIGGMHRVAQTMLFGFALLCTDPPSAAEPSVTMHSAAQIPGTKTVEITCTVTGGEAGNLSVTLEVYDGATLVHTAAGLSAGQNQSVTWDSGSHWDGQVGTLTFKVVAADHDDPSDMVFVQGGTLPNIGNGVIEVSSFYIGRYEVTKAEWDEVYAWATHADRGAQVYHFDRAGSGFAPDHPVHTVNWYDAVKWSNARSEKEDRTPAYMSGDAAYRTGRVNNVAVNPDANGYRLPTYAEWEFAARGGVHSQGYTFSGGNDLNAVAWYSDNSWQVGRTSPVGQKAANELGIHDMTGNVWEWCFDWRPTHVDSFRAYRGGTGSGRTMLNRCSRRNRLRDGARPSNEVDVRSASRR